MGVSLRVFDLRWGLELHPNVRLAKCKAYQFYHCQIAARSVSG
jgi:hypothetical protein